jgi:hypothetical protein
MSEAVVTCKSYTLRKDGTWLGQILVSSDGMVAGVTDYGNFSYTWRSFGESIEEFILSINTSYFGGKIAFGNAFIQRPSRTAEKAYQRLAEIILPALQAEIRSQA